MSTWGPSDKTEVRMCEQQLDDTREINVWFSNGGHHSGSTPPKGTGKHAVEALPEWLPASDCARKDGGVRSNHGLTLQSFQLPSLSWIANLPWRCRR